MGGPGSGGKRRIPPEEDERRLALWRQGLSDLAIGRIVGRKPGTITRWREIRGLPRNWIYQRKPGPVPASQGPAPKVPMESVLSPEQCRAMREFLGWLDEAVKPLPLGEKPRIMAFIQAWRG